jgi:endonuclease/exonuclease/phosphatase family metal-dependent hydrolase
MFSKKRFTAFAFAALIAACSDESVTAPREATDPSDAVDQTSQAEPPGKELTFLSRNVYLGADLAPIIGVPVPQLIPIRTAEVWASVQATNFPERAKALADEIVGAQPDLVGLQEVSLWRTQFPGDAHLPNGVAATDTAFDFLQILLDELAARGQHYVVASVGQGVDAELFYFTGAPGASLTRDVRMTDRDVILAKNNVTIFNALGGQYAAKVTIPLGGAGGPPVTIPRAWASVDAKFHGETIRFFNTHLEVESGSFAPLQVAQGNEAIAMLSTSPYPVVAVGDYNSPTDGSATPTYANLLAAGFNDVWPLVSMGDPGFSAGLRDDLLGPVTDLKTRIDLALFKGNIAAVSAHLVGNQETDRTPSGLLPSDHAGLVATVRLGVK